jgi:hypothetical protein
MAKANADSPLDDLPPTSFEGIAFPVESIEVRGSIREHVHQYAHANGGSVEKMGLNPYEIAIDAPFMNVFSAYASAPALWPDAINTLVAYFENQHTGKLFIPTVGTFSAYCLNWTRKLVAKLKSGERATLAFKEDTTDAVELFDTGLRPTLELASASLQTLLPAAPKLSLFDRLQDAVNDVGKLLDAPDRLGALAEAKLLYIADLCKQIDSLPAMLGAQNHRTVNALHELWDAALRLANDVAGKNTGPRLYVVPAPMTVGQVSAAVFNGDMSRGMDILRMNAIEDAFLIPKSTKIRYYAEAA